MKKSSLLLIFILDELRYALHLSAAERIVRAVEITPLPKSPEIVLGVINVQGQIISVVSIRRRFGLPAREIELSDRFIVAHTSRRTVVMVADAVVGVIEASEQEMIRAEKIVPGLEHIEGVIKLESGILLICNLDKFLSLEEEAILDQAMEEVKTNGL